MLFPGRLAWLLGAIAATSVLVFAACGDDDANSTATVIATAQAQGTKAPETSSTAKGATATSGTTGGNATLEKLRKDIKGATYRATYDGTISASTGQAIDGTFTLGAKGGTNLFGVKGNVAGQQVNILLIDNGTDTFTCIEAGGQKQCLKAKTGSGNSIIGSLTVDGVIAGVSQDKSTTVSPIAGQTIANTKGACSAVKGTSTDGTLCTAEGNGVLLLLNGTFSGNKVSLKATNVNGSPSDDDFKPPYAVTELAGGGGR